MSSKSKIEWTEATWNPVTGCTKVSPGCAHCYAERITNRFGGPGAFDKVVLHPDRLELPLRWKKPRMIFVNSMSDLFHEDVPDEFIDRTLTVIDLCPQHTFQVLTKRPDRMQEYLTKRGAIKKSLVLTKIGVRAWPLPNVWLGVSVENQRLADQRIPLLLQTPAAVRWVSVEPLLAPVSFRWAKWEPFRDRNHLDGLRRLDWVVVGGESGPEARPMHPGWAHALRDQCVEAGVSFFFKQWGEWLPGGQKGSVVLKMHGVSLHALPIAGRVCMIEKQPFSRLGKKKAGRLLDGREWNEMPQSANQIVSATSARRE